MEINLIYDSSVDSAPPGFETAVAAAAQDLDNLITNPITVNVDVGYGENNGKAIPAGVLGVATVPIGVQVTYAQLRSDLQASASSAADLTAIANLPLTDPSHGAGFHIAPAQEKALGLLPASGTEIDDNIGFSSSYANFDFDPADRSQPNEFDFVGKAEDELTHVLGRTGGAAPLRYYALDLFRYSAPGVLQPFAGQPAYFSIDGGKTALNEYSTMTVAGTNIIAYADWNGTSAGPDAFDDSSAPVGVENPITSTDITELDVLGYSVSGDDTPPAANFQVTDTSSGVSFAASGSAYLGPVNDLQYQYVEITTDNLSIAATTPNAFMHSGSGEDAIAALAGTNVLDGGTGSNFLTGGTGTDTFFVDDRGPSADIWSTVANFHAGDAATVWGVTPQDFTLTWQDRQGAAGYTGLTLHVMAPGVPEASLTLTGYSSADLGNGKIAVSFGTDPVSGSSFMYIVGNS